MSSKRPSSNSKSLDSQPNKKKKTNSNSSKVVESAMAPRKQKEKETNTEFSLDKVVRPFNRADFIYQDLQENQVTSMLNNSFKVVVKKVTIKELLHMLCYIDGEVVGPKVNHHFVSHDNQYHALKNAFELELKQRTTMLNNRFYVTCFNLSPSQSNRDGNDSISTISHGLVPLFTMNGGNQVDSFYASIVTDADIITTQLIDLTRTDKFALEENRWKEDNHNPNSYHIAACDGGHRMQAFLELAQNKETVDLLHDEYKLELHFLVPKVTSTAYTSAELLDKYQAISNNLMHITKAGKGHTLWDTFQTIFNLLRVELEHPSNETSYIGRMVPVSITNKNGTALKLKLVPALLFCKDPATIYRAFGGIFHDIIRALLKHEELKAEWMHFYDKEISDETEILRPLHNLHCYKTLDRFTTFMGTDLYEAFSSANRYHTVKLKIQKINMPFQFIQIFQVILAATISKEHFNSIHNYLQKMDSKNLLDLPKLLYLVSVADDLANHPQLFKSRNTHNMRRARKVYHAMMLLSIFEGYSTFGPFPQYPTHWCYRIHYAHDLNMLLKQYDKQFENTCNYSGPEHKLDRFEEEIFTHDQAPVQLDDIDTKKWTCPTDIFLHFYIMYIKSLTSKPWYKGINTVTSAFNEHLSRSNNISTSDLYLPSTHPLHNKKHSEPLKTIPFSFKTVMKTLFEPFPTNSDKYTLESTAFWKINDLTNYDKWFGFHPKNVMNSNNDEDDSVLLPYTQCKTLEEFKTMALQEYENQDTKQSRKKEIARVWFILDQNMKMDKFNWDDSLLFHQHLENSDKTSKFTYSDMNEFKCFQNQSYIHYNLPSTSTGMKASLVSAYLSLDVMVNIRNIPFTTSKEVSAILEQLDTKEYTVFDITRADDSVPV